MATLPRARVTIDDEAVAFGAGEDVIAICAPVPGTTAPECTLYSSTKELLDDHGYCQGAAYAALHQDETGLPVLFVAMPVGTAGGITHVDVSGVTGTSVVSLAAGADGVLEQVDGAFVVTSGGTVGTDTIVGDLSLDGGFTTRSVRIGTATSYAIPYVGQVMNLGAGDLAVGDTVAWKSYGPKWAAADLPAVREALAAQSVQVRSCIFIGDAESETKIEAVRAAMEAYATTSERYTLARVQLRDRYRTADLVAGAAELTFGDGTATITRDVGSFVTDGFKVGMRVTIAGSANNDADDYEVVTVTATVLTVDTNLTAETIDGADLTTFQGVEAKSDWRAGVIADVEDISGDTARRIDPAGGYGAKLDPITGWRLRRPIAWAFSLREYQHDVHVAAWRVADGGFAGWTLEDASGAVVEHDERVDGGLLAANITCARTLNNEPGVFGALSLTRADPASLLSRTHNMYVANVACTAVQRATQREEGQSLTLIQTGANKGKATEASLVKLEKRVNQGVALALRDTRGEGDRATGADWVASRSDVLNIPGATVTGILTLDLNGTIEQMNTTVRVPSGG